MPQESHTNQRTMSPGAMGGTARLTERQRRIAQMIARAWSDAQFKAKLLQRPDEAFAEYAIDLPAGKMVRAVEDTPELFHFILPPRPAEGDHVVLARGSRQSTADAGVANDDCGGCESCHHSGGCGGCGDCHHCHHSGGCGGCGDCHHCGHCEGGEPPDELG